MVSIPALGTKAAENDTFRGRISALYQAIFVNYWPYWAACLTAAILNIFLLAYWGGAWGLTAELTRWGGHILQALGVPVENWLYFQDIGIDGSPLTRGSGWLLIGMFGGALVAALLSGNFRIRMPQQKRRLLQGFAGGVLAGFGARLAMGCNLGSFFSAIPQFSLHGWVFMLGLFPGTYLGTKIALHPLIMGRPTARRSRAVRRTPQKKPIGISQQAVGALLAIALVALILYAAGIEAAFGVLLLFGIGFGFLIQRGRICFTSAFREMWITRQGDLGRALAFSMMVSTLGFAVLIYNGIGGNLQIVHPGILVGGILFGIGIVLAGGCESGWIYRSMEGYVQLWMAGLGTIVGATFLAWAWDGLHIYDIFVAGWPAISLIEVWGWPTAILATLALLFGWYLLITWWETRKPVQQTVGVTAPQATDAQSKVPTPVASTVGAQKAPSA